jgi:predicted MFS family arabinose efflux permease
LNNITKVSFVIPGLANLFFVAGVIGISMALGIEGEVATARVATIMAVVVMGTCFSLTWGLLMQPRPALNTLKEGEHIVTQGFKQIYRTIKRLYRTNISLLWFYLAVALGDFKPLTGVALTFLSSHQQFDSVDLGIAAMVILIGSIPGASVSSFMCRKVNPVRSSVICLICFIVVTLSASIFLRSPEQKVGTFVVVALWGIVGGWKITSTNMLVAAIIPEGQDAELVGWCCCVFTQKQFFP